MEIYFNNIVVVYNIIFNIFSQVGFLNSGTIDILGWMLVHCGGLSYAFWAFYQHP